MGMRSGGIRYDEGGEDLESLNRFPFSQTKSMREKIQAVREQTVMVAQEK